jgi:hypothetical protein
LATSNQLQEGRSKSRLATDGDGCRTIVVTSRKIRHEKVSAKANLQQVLSHPRVVEVAPPPPKRRHQDPWSDNRAN